MGHYGRTFIDRRDAGRQLAGRLREEGLTADALVLALPRGGLPVGLEIAAALDAELDVLLVRKLGAPLNPELAAGAIATGEITVYNHEVLRLLGMGEQDLERTRERELAELRRRERAYRGERPPPELRGKRLILVDDGAATGSTMEAAVAAVRKLEPAEVVVALPTAAADTVHRLARKADRVICLVAPEPYIAVGASYQTFEQLSDADVVECLERARRKGGGEEPAASD